MFGEKEKEDGRKQEGRRGTGMRSSKVIYGTLRGMKEKRKEGRKGEWKRNVGTI